MAQTRSSRGFSLQVNAGVVQMRPADASAVAYIPIPSNPIDYTTKRVFHDKPWSIAFAIGWLAFFCIGGILKTNALSSNFAVDGSIVQQLAEENKQCYCEHFPLSPLAHGCQPGRQLASEHRQLITDHHRRLADAIQKGQTIWSLLSNMPEVPATMIMSVIAISIGWILALQKPAISRATVAFTLACKIAFLVYLGIKTTDEAQIFFFAMAVLACLVIYNSRAAIELSCKLISEAASGLAANPGIVGTCVLAYLPYVVYIFLWMTFLAASGMNWVIKPFTSHGFNNEFNNFQPPTPVVTGCPSGASSCGCTVELAALAPQGVRYMIFHFMWVTGFLAQVRLMVVSGSIGTWYFQGTQNVPSKPSFFWLKTALTTSGGSLTVGATIAAVVEWIKMKASAKCWCLSPSGILARIILCAFQTLIMAITRMCTVVHVFTGDSFCNAKTRTFALLKRNFVGGVVTETISKMLFNCAGFLFAVALTFASWAWYENSGANASGHKLLSQGGWQMYLWVFLVLFMVYDPILWVFLIGMVLAPNVTGLLGGYPVIIPLCSIFIGCIANMCFKYMAGVMMDATSAIFVSFAIDRENGTVSNNRESMRKILGSMPCMYSIVAMQPVNLVAQGQPVVQGVAVPMTPVPMMASVPASDIEMGAAPQFDPVTGAPLNDAAVKLRGGQ